MGWKIFAIIVHKPTSIDNESLLKELGYENLSKIDDEPFDVAIYPDKNKVYIGTYKENLIICESDLPMQFFEQAETKTEKALTKIFPTSEICSLVLHSVVNLWGYAVIQNEKKIRARAGSADDGTFLEQGEPLEEENEILSKSTIDKDGKRTYLFEDLDEEPMSEDQVGENFVFSISKRYFEEELDAADDRLFETILTGYSFSPSKPIPAQSTTIVQEKKESKPWWKFW
jgi:hypothetical protein